MNDIKVWIDGHNVEVTGVIPISDYVIATPQTGKLWRSEVKSYCHTRYSKVLLEGENP
jgi:hypothetical protein